MRRTRSAARYRVRAAIEIFVRQFHLRASPLSCLSVTGGSDDDDLTITSLFRA
jgi:hypothetical protein